MTHSEVGQRPARGFVNTGSKSAMAAAVADAVGVRLFEIPLTLEKVYSELQAKLDNSSTSEAKSDLSLPG